MWNKRHQLAVYKEITWWKEKLRVGKGKAYGKSLMNSKRFTLIFIPNYIEHNSIDFLSLIKK